MLEDLIHTRKHFCDNERPASVKATCGDTCVVVVKIHSTFVDNRMEEYKQLITYEGARSIIVERDETSRSCSLAFAHKTDFGHFPGQGGHNDTTCPKAQPPTGPAKEHHQVARQVLREVSRPALESPFLNFVTHTEAAKRATLGFVGLSVPGPEWEDACGVSWCSTYRWPDIGSQNNYTSGGQYDPRNLGGGRQHDPLWEGILIGIAISLLTGFGVASWQRKMMVANSLPCKESEDIPLMDATVA